jgi:hypothetical protein
VPPYGQKLHHHRDLGPQQRQVRAETAQGGLRAIDYAAPYVDGRRPPDPSTDRHRKAFDQIKLAETVLGQDAAALVRAILINGMTVAQVMEACGLSGRTWSDYIGRWYIQCLDALARAYGFATATRWTKTLH